MCDKRDRAITCVFCRGLRFTLMFSRRLQKDLFKGRWSLAEGFNRQNYCQACYTTFAVFFSLLLLRKITMKEFTLIVASWVIRVRWREI